jgi:DNA-binding HxlR family transcriptional regulator
MPDAHEDLERALRVATDDQIDGLRRVAAKMRAIAPYPLSPTREIMARLGERWSPLLLSLLSTGAYRHNELHRVVDVMVRLAENSPISRRMLMLSLRALERDGLVHRSVGTGNAPAVEYSLTPLGVSLHEKFEALIDWAIEHSAAMRAAQQDFDGRDAMPAEVQRHRLR